ncbi:MAG: protein kinase [Deltaproteobacteria bacterium]|nr:protein kinase [Deltaproteobacteria bacterium]
MTQAELSFEASGRFQLLRRLGEGGMGVVYEASDRAQHGARVAIKTLRGMSEHGLARLKNEFDLLRDLEHPNLVRLRELLCENGHWFLTMELLEGEDFLAHVRQRGSGPQGFDESRLRHALRQVARGVHALHATHKVHRDIKPSNVLVTGEGRAVLLDFGLVADVVESAASTSRVVGTVEYMAPEQAASKPVGPAADWYSVGAMLYQALTGRLPFAGAPLEIMMNKHRYEPPPPRAFVPSAPADLDALCVALLRYDPADRPSGDSVLERLGEKERGTPSAPPVTQRTLFVGRREELGFLGDALAASRRNSVTVLVHGESGLGKTALVREFIHGLRSVQRVVVLSSRCYERESVPFQAWAGIIERLAASLRHLDPVEAAHLLPRDVAVLARVFPVLRRVPEVVKMAQAGHEQPSSLAELRSRAFHALRELLSRMADKQPVVLFIDDFQWADVDSLGLLTELLHPPLAPPVLVVASVRSSGTAEPPASVSAVAGEIGEVRQLKLGGLPLEDARALAWELLSPEVRPGFLEDASAIADEAGGHPMFIQELARHVSGLERRSGLAKLDDALWDRIQRLKAPARQLLQLIAVAGVPIRARTAARALGTQALRVSRWLGLLSAANLVRSTRTTSVEVHEPYHDRVREAVVARLSDEVRKELHARLADALDADGAAEHDPWVLVRHLESAGETERAASQAERAAAKSSEKLAFDQAASLYRSALRLGRHSAESQRRLLLLLADALVDAGRGPAAADAFLDAARAAPSVVRVECHRRAAEQLLASGYIDQGMRALDAVLSDVGGALPGSPRMALGSLLLRRAWLRVRGLGFTARDEWEVSPRELLRMDVYRGVASGLAMIDTIRGADFQARGLLLALRSGERRRVARSLYQESVYVGSQGSRGASRARKLARAAREISGAQGDPYLSAWDAASEGIVDFLAGEFPSAAEKLVEAEIRFRDRTTGNAWELGTVRLILLGALRHLGGFRELKRRFDEYARDAARRGDRYFETSLTRAYNATWLVEDKVAEARRDLERKSWTPPERGYHMQHWYGLRAHGELALYAGETAGAMARLGPSFAALGPALLLRVQLVRTESAWLRGRLALAEAAARNDDGQASRMLATARSAAKELLREGVNHASTWAALLQAAVLTLEGKTERAIGRLRETIALAETGSLLPCAAAARYRLGELLGGVEGKALVGQAEASMAEAGSRNPVRLFEVMAPGFGR